VDDWKQRVRDEKKDLCDKLAKLRQFRTTAEYAALDEADRQLLKQQDDYMQAYADILGKRIARF